MRRASWLAVAAAGASAYVALRARAHRRVRRELPPNAPRVVILILLFRMPGLRNRLATALDWAADYFQQQDTARLDLIPAPTPVDVEGALRGR